MVVVYFVPFVLIIAFALVGVAGAYALLRSLTKIIFWILVVASVVIGITMIITAVKKAVKEKCFFSSVVQIIKGIFICLILTLTKYWFDIGSSLKPFNNSEFILFGTFNKIDEYLISILVSSVLILVCFIPELLFKRKAIAFNFIFSILVCCVIFIGGFKISLDSEMINAYDLFNWDSPEYIVTERTSIIHEEIFFSPIKTGTFEKGANLYKSDYKRTYNDIKYVLVSDGEKAGYVCVDNLESLVTYTYIVNKDSNVYAIGYAEGYMWENGERYTISVPVPSNEIIEFVNKGTVVQKIGTHAEKMKVTHMKVKLSNGKEGYIDFENVTEVRK